MEDPPLKSLKFLSQSTDSLHKTSKVSESTESLTDEGKSLHFILESLPIYTNQVWLIIYCVVIHTIENTLLLLLFIHKIFYNHFYLFFGKKNI